MTIHEIAHKLGITEYQEDTPNERMQSVINQSLFFDSVEVVHLKTGNHYQVEAVYLNCTNKDDGRWMIKYSNNLSELEFVRDAEEFFEKFKLIGSN